jgi:putative ABC transport system substrate-binding protein
MVRTLLLALLLRCCLFHCAIAQDKSILVLYPQTTIPYQQAYQQIIEGIRHSTRLPLKSLTLPEKFNPKKIQYWIDTSSGSPGYLIVLGRRSLQAVKLLQHNHQLLAGAIEILPGNNHPPGVSIHIDPSVYLKHLSILSPNTTKLILFYNSENKDLLPLAENAAQQHGIEITPIPVPNIETAIRSIAEALKLSDPEDTAIWFTHNVIGLNTELLYPYILEISWHRRIPVFSGMISHTKRGFLFSLYPDFLGIGKELGEIIIQHDRGETELSIRFTKAAKFILNTRTAQHLGLPIDDETLNKADVLFPAK